MEGDYTEELNQILAKLQFKSIEDLLQADAIAPDKIANRSRTHEIIIVKYLNRLHEIILKTQLLQKKISPDDEKQPIIDLKEIYPEVNMVIEEGEIVEVLGRANSGKSTFMAECMIQTLKNNRTPILLNSGSCEVIYKENLKPHKVLSFQFSTLSDVAMLLHSIGNEILNRKTQRKYVIFIDCLSQVELQDDTIEFDCSEKFRRLLTTFANRTQTLIMYSFRITQSLFSTQYKKQYHRFKCKNSKEWDGWAGKTIVIDHMIRKKDNRSIVRINLPKSLNNNIYEIIR